MEFKVFVFCQRPEASKAADSIRPLKIEKLTRKVNFHFLWRHLLRLDTTLCC